MPLPRSLSPRRYAALSRARRCGWLLACLGLLVAAQLGAALPQAGVKGTVGGKRGAVLVGSSSIRGTFGRLIAADLERRGFQVTRRGLVSAGLARPDFRDFDQLLDETPIDRDTFAVFVYVGMNDGQAIWLRPGERQPDGKRWLSWHHPRWPEVYARRARNVFRSICARGAQHAIVMLPVAVAKPSLERKLTRIRRLQRQAARGVSCARAISTTGDPAQFRRESKRLRLADGFHMSRLGALRVWQRVQQRALPLVRLPGVRRAAGAIAADPARASEQ